MAVSAADWIARSAWHLRSSEFGPLVLTQGCPAIELDGVHAELWDRWLRLPSYPTIIEPVCPARVRYAAIDWTVKPIPLTGAQAHSKLAGVGIELAQTLEWLLQNVHTGDAAWFTNPIAKLDLDGELRIAFITRGDATPPESFINWPHCDERGFVFVVGKTLMRMIDGAMADPIGRILDRCVAESPDQRFATLDDLVETLRHLGAPARPRAHLRNLRRYFTRVERGLGYLALGNNGAAAHCFYDAMRLTPNFDLAFQLRAHVIGLPDAPGATVGEITIPIVPRRGFPEIAVPEVSRHAPVAELPQPPRRVYASARGLVASSVIRTYLDPPANDAPVAMLLRTRRYSDALAACETQLAETPDDAAHHHLRGKSLLGLGRLDDARAAFDRACTLEPKMLEAMLLRREVDRAIVAARGAAGTAQPMRMSLPPHLAELRDVLIAGRLVDAIQMLRRPEYDDDTVAQLLRAELLCSDGRAEEALAIYDRIATSAARLGRVRALISLGRTTEALAEAEQLIGVDDEALELRAHALLALDRGDEAEAQLAEYMRVVAQRSERRVRSL